ncbi:hypothetical protein [Pseudomonas brassicacearum]|uniref:Uncharacterized protein n=1 Tax=Pseudomonas brassicacearum TaxID=930166 RepID=A0A423H1X1_9PSED|nr:hypothetical protein [Pseudomonas brassicacearum]RON06228.1 hypothetical protein BK658_00105 [Pseudomonas brassicacearum]
MPNRFNHMAAVMALLFTVGTVQASDNLLTGRLYGAEAMPERMVEVIEYVHLVDVGPKAPVEAVDDLRNVLPVFWIASGEALERPELRGTIARAHLLMAKSYTAATQRRGCSAVPISGVGGPVRQADRLRHGEVAERGLRCPVA